MIYNRTYIDIHRNTESIDHLFQFPKFCLVRCFTLLFTTQAYAQSAKWKKSLIHWNENQKKIATIGFQLHHPKLSRESCFTHFLNYRELCKESSTKQATDITSPVDTGRKLNIHKTLRRRPGRLLNVLMYVQFTSCVYGVQRRAIFMENHGNNKKINLQFHYCNFSEQSNLYFLLLQVLYWREKGERSFLHFLENW